MTQRLAAWVHYVKHETEPDKDRLLMAQDIERLLAVADAALSVLSEDGVKEQLSAYVMGVELIDRLAALEAE